MKRRINLIGDSFTHLTGGNKGYSVHGKESQYVEWVFNFSSSESFYIDNYIDSVFSDNIPGTKYAWLLESKSICPEINSSIKRNWQKYFQHFKYIFTHNKELLKLDSRFKWCPAQGTWIKNPKIYKKTKLISVISSNKYFTEGQKFRLDWINKNKNFLDVYGRGFNEIQNKEDGLCDYMFSVAIENDFYESYFTEKILDCFATGTIPIYKGTSDISKYFNRDGIIIFDEEKVEISAETYYNKMDAILDNLEKIKQYNIPEDFIYKNYLKKNMSVLVYVGANSGYSLQKYVDKYEHIYAFEPDPEMFSILKNNFENKSNITLINSACYLEKEKKTLYVTENRVSSSLAELSDFSITNGFSGGTMSFKNVEIDCINLCDFLLENGVDYINTLITDCQGSDLMILRTLKYFIDNKKINEIFCETHLNGVELYEGLQNHYDGFKDILSKNYVVKDFYFDGTLVSKEVPPFVEWDTHWVLK